MRLIDADKLYPDCMTKNGTLAISQSQIANAPTVERPQGEWELSSIQVVGENWYKCSICGRKIRTSTYHLKEYPFCHCGAAMRGKDE